MPTNKFTTIVLGSGNAGLTAATTAALQGSRKVLLIDKCPFAHRGGNTYFSAGAFRTVFCGLSDILPLVSNVPPDLIESIDMTAYTEEEFLDDIMRVSGGRADGALAERVVRGSRDAIGWLAERGVGFELSFSRQTYKVDGRYKFWGGMVFCVEDGGKGLIADHLRSASAAGVEIWWDTPAISLILEKDTIDKVIGVTVLRNGKLTSLYASSIVLASGGFEADAKKRVEFLGPGWDLAHVRGTQHNTGDGFELAKAVYAKEIGNWSGCHATAWDAGAPLEAGDRELTNRLTKSGYPLGIMVNTSGHRFVDEGEDFRNFTYAKFGSAILSQPSGVAFQIWDSKATPWLRTEEYADEIIITQKITAESIPELAQKCAQEGLTSPETFISTIASYNAAATSHRSENPELKWNPAVKDRLCTQSSTHTLAIPKSNWALPLDKPPFTAVKVACGITFTFGGLQIDPATAAVISRATGREVEGLYAVGEMVGGLFWGNYPGGSGLTAGTVFGRIAGGQAAMRAVRVEKKEVVEGG